MKEKPKLDCIVYGWIKKYCSANICPQNVETYLECFTCISSNVIKHVCRDSPFKCNAINVM